MNPAPVVPSNGNPCGRAVILEVAEAGVHLSLSCALVRETSRFLGLQEAR